MRRVPRSERTGRVVACWPEGRIAAEAASNRAIADLRARLGGSGAKMAHSRVAWNVFRHTFASHLVQAGVSIWKVSRWLGNSPAVCERHYAAMLPEHDRDIERVQ